MVSKRNQKLIDEIVALNYNQMLGHVKKKYFTGKNYWLEMSGWAAEDLLNEGVVKFLKYIDDEQLDSSNNVESYIVGSIVKINVHSIVLNLVRDYKTRTESNKDLTKHLKETMMDNQEIQRFEMENALENLSEVERSFIRNEDMTIQDFTKAMGIQTKGYYSIKEDIREKFLDWGIMKE